MGLLAKLKLLIKTAKPVGKFINEVKGAKRKWKTIPFWVSVLGSGIALVGSLQGVIPVTVSVVITGVLTAGYNIVRGLDKADQEGVKPTLKSTEFWVGALGIISTQLVSVKAAGVDNDTLTIVAGIIAGAMAVAQNIGAQQPKDVEKMLAETPPESK